MKKKLTVNLDAVKALKEKDLQRVVGGDLSRPPPTIIPEKKT